MVFSRSIVLLLFLFVVVSLSRAADEAKNDSDDKENPKPSYTMMQNHYDGLGNEDGFVSYDEIKRALGRTTEEEWRTEIEPHDNGDNLLDPTEFENWMRSFRKTEL
ncbi:uncharacterized protein LOC114520127 [Dendronephthya gigantea]|uniref:uncharacterized protein LOC114520127 n=1 Tax=Dendronephthya gigantea TaxID=151771 RepID=UPI00106C60F2|nr:uncharacterized protein LOC114520127 [Dendronephthya gigantea]